MNLFSKITAGTQGKQEITVQKKDTALAYGSGLVEVFATPAMIALMENTAHLSVQNDLPEGYLTVGSEVSIKHIKATGVGKKVWAVSQLTAVEGKKLTFETEAFDEEGKIGFGSHTRYMVEKKKFLEVLLGK